MIRKVLSPRKLELSASLMCADFSALHRQLDALWAAGVRRLHLDFADGHFVPSLILGTEVFKLLERRQGFFVESHLMIEEPYSLVDLFAPGSDLIVVHVEAAQDLMECVRRIRDQEVKVGVALNPDTPVDAVFPLLKHVDMVTILGVIPGFAGGKFIPSTVSRVAAVREAMLACDCHVDLEVDGSINENTIGVLSQAGANVFVGGSSGLFTGAEIEGQVRKLLSTAHDQLTRPR